jgi:hypothetical protein
MLSDPSVKLQADDEYTDDASWIVRVDMGEKPSGGYRLDLRSEELSLSGQTARFAMEWQIPDPDSMQIQMVTYPCLYLKIAKGEYKRLTVVDEEGNEKHALDLP